MSQIQLLPTDAIAELDSEHRLHTVLTSALKARGQEANRHPEEREPYWDADHFGLTRASLFRQATPTQKKSILALASNGLLEEACSIEKSGMSFTAKMTLLSETTQERMLYSLFSTDEAIHLHQIRSHLPDESVKPGSSSENNPFIRLLSDIIREGDRNSLVFLIQVVLEGWGITHYHSLAESCKDPSVRESLRLILKDEARHHGSGVVLVRSRELDSRQKSYILETMTYFLRMVQCGPQGLVSAVERVLGHLSKEQKTRLFSELECERITADKLDTLRGLIAHGSHGGVPNGMAGILHGLEKSGAFRAMTPEECAKISIGA